MRPRRLKKHREKTADGRRDAACPTTADVRRGGRPVGSRRARRVGSHCRRGAAAAPVRTLRRVCGNSPRRRARRCGNSPRGARALRKQPRRRERAGAETAPRRERAVRKQPRVRARAFAETARVRARLCGRCDVRARAFADAAENLHVTAKSHD
ncbi:UNVERIFIED_CONTAM: hypothetical protein Sindi_3012100 [Sesamum indicum]